MDIVVSVSSGIVMGWCVIVGSLIVIMVSSMMVDVIVKSVVCELGMVLLFQILLRLVKLLSVFSFGLVCGVNVVILS